jgi:hypothetical protein
MKILIMENIKANFFVWGHDAIITAIKIACDKVLELAAENVSSKIDKQTILKIKDWIK